MEFMTYLAGIDPQQALLMLCLVLVLAMFAALFLLHRRTRRAEKQVAEMGRSVCEQLAAADERSRESSQQQQREISEAMQNVSDSMVRMMGEMTRTQQGQMDSIGGQLRAVGRQEEERMERMRETMDRRLNAYEERLGGVTRTLDDKLSGNEARMERMRETLEGGLQRMSDANRNQLEQMRQTVDEKLSATVDQRLEASFAQVTRRLEQVTSSLNAMQSLAGSVDELSRTLGGAQPRGQRFRFRKMVMAAERDRPARFGKGFGTGAADAARSAGDERVFHMCNTSCTYYIGIQGRRAREK